MEGRFRRIRPTLRCLSDLGIDVPPVSSSVEDLDHAIFDKAASLAPAHPENQVRIQAIEDTLVYRFTHGRHRVLTWLDANADVLWLCAADIRRENEGYDEFVGRHIRGELLPTAEDIRRMEDEAIIRLARAITDGTPAWIADARANPSDERRFALPGGATIRVYCDQSAGTEALWIAIPTLLAQELGLPDRIRALIVASVTEALGDGGATVEFEQRHDWPAGTLQSFEVAFFWIAA